MAPAVAEKSFDRQVSRLVAEDTRTRQLSKTLERDREGKQKLCNDLYSARQQAEERGEADLADKLGRDFKEKQVLLLLPITFISKYLSSGCTQEGGGPVTSPSGSSAAARYEEKCRGEGDGHGRCAALHALQQVCPR